MKKSKWTPEYRSEYMKRYREANSEKIKIQQHIRNNDNVEYRKKWYAEHIEHRKEWVVENREKVREEQINWRKKNPRYHHDYYQKHKEKISKYMSEYCKNNRDKINEKRKLKKKNQ